MNIEKVARKALTIIKLRYGLPKSGFLAGGSLANIMWELVSGNKAIVNDIDIFLFSRSEEKSMQYKKEFKFEKIETSYFQSYNHICTGSSIKDSYVIKDTTNEGVFNFVNYESTNSSPDLILESFDINCTRVGYSIDEDKFYFKSDFEYFLNSGNLQVSNLNTPAHTAIRLVKKSKELNANLNDSELEISQYILSNRAYFYDLNRVRFMQRYANMFLKYIDKLGKYFKIERDLGLEEWLKKKEIDEKIYFLHPLTSPYSPSNFKNAPSVTSEFLFYLREVHNNPYMMKIWDDIGPLYYSSEYMDCKAEQSDISQLSGLIKSYPSIINNIRGLKFSEQINITKLVIDNISKYYDFNTAIAVLENVKLTTDMKFDEDDCLILGLSVRKKINNFDLSTSDIGF